MNILENVKHKIFESNDDSFNILNTPIVTNKRFFKCRFINVYFTSKFKNCYFDNCVFDNCYFIETNFNKCVFVENTFDKTKFEICTCLDCLFNVSTFDRGMIDITLKTSIFNEIILNNTIIVNIELKDSTISYSRFIESRGNITNDSHSKIRNTHFNEIFIA